MSCLETFKVNLDELKEGVTALNFTLDDAFFHAVEATEVSSGQVDAALSIRKTENYYTLTAHVEGVVIVPCDRCLDDMELPISIDAEANICVASKDEEDMIQSLQPTDDGVVDVSWWLYENVALMIPIQHVHDTGKCNAEMMKTLQEYSAARSSNGTDAGTDPRWNKLKELMPKGE